MYTYVKLRDKFIENVNTFEHWILPRSSLPTGDDISRSVSILVDSLSGRGTEMSMNRQWISSKKKKKKTKRNTEGRRGHFYHGHCSYTAYVCEMLSEKHDRHPISLMSRKPALIERISNKRRQLRVTYFHCHDCREPRNVPPRYPFTSSLLFDTSDRWIVELIHRWRSTISSSNFLPLKILLLFSSLVQIKIIPILRIQ